LNYAQEKNDVKLKSLRVNFLNPAVELEIPTGQYSTSSALRWLWRRISDLTYGGSLFILLVHLLIFNKMVLQQIKETKKKYGK
jgi:hypothetical protein